MADVIVALDVPSQEDAWRVIDRIEDLRWVKVGSVLAGRAGPDFLRQLADRGLRVFLDLKWHDIPNTVAGAVAGARDLGVAMATVHTLGGQAMMAAAAAATRDGVPALVGVTVLTSHTEEAWASILGRTRVDLGDEVSRLTGDAIAAGLAGVVCSPREIARVRPLVGEGGLIVTPGVRREADAQGDQQRVATPGLAASLGATHLVVGRPIVASDDPGRAFRAIAKEARCEG